MEVSWRDNRGDGIDMVEEEEEEEKEEENKEEEERKKKKKEEEENEVSWRDNGGAKSRSNAPASLLAQHTPQFFATKYQKGFKSIRLYTR